MKKSKTHQQRFNFCHPPKLLAVLSLLLMLIFSSSLATSDSTEYTKVKDFGELTLSRTDMVNLMFSNYIKKADPNDELSTTRITFRVDNEYKNAITITNNFYDNGIEELTFGQLDFVTRCDTILSLPSTSSSVLGSSEYEKLFEKTNMGSRLTKVYLVCEGAENKAFFIEVSLGSNAYRDYQTYKDLNADDKVKFVQLFKKPGDTTSNIP